MDWIGLSPEKLTHVQLWDGQRHHRRTLEPAEGSSRTGLLCAGSHSWSAVCGKSTVVLQVLRGRRHPGTVTVATMRA